MKFGEYKEIMMDQEQYRQEVKVRKDDFHKKWQFTYDFHPEPDNPQVFHIKFMQMLEWITSHYKVSEYEVDPELSRGALVGINDENLAFEFKMTWM
jgi:hypothetical protein